MTRRRDTVSNTLPTMLAEIDRYSRSIDGALRDPSAAPQLDCHWVFTFISASGKRIGVERGQLDGSADGWPLPGRYEADYVDSEGNSVVQEPWRGEQLDPDDLREAMKRRENESPATFLFEQYQIQMRGQRAELDAARTREAAARVDLNKQVDIAADLQRKKNDAVAQAAKAIADKELAESRQKEAEDALEALERDLSRFKPQLHAVADRMIQRGIEAFGGDVKLVLADETSAANGANGGANGKHASPPAEPRDAPFDGAAAEDVPRHVNDVLRATVFDPEVARELYAMGILSWETIRSLLYLQYGRDLGPDPVWPDEPGAPPARGPHADAPSAEAG